MCFCVENVYVDLHVYTYVWYLQLVTAVRGWINTGWDIKQHEQIIQFKQIVKYHGLNWSTTVGKPRKRSATDRGFPPTPMYIMKSNQLTQMRNSGKIYIFQNSWHARISDRVGSFPPRSAKTGKQNKEILFRCLYRMINLHLLVLGYFRELSGGYTCKTILSVYTANIQGHPHFVDTFENFIWSRNLWNVRYVEYFTWSYSLNKSIKTWNFNS